MDETNDIVKPMEVDSMANGMMNGISNGSSHKEHKHRHRDKDSHKSSHKSRDRERSRDHSSHKSSHKDKNRDKDRHRDKHKESSDRDKHRSKDDRHRSSDDKHRDSHKSKDKDRKSSSSGEKRDKDRHHSSHKSSHRDRNRESSSSIKDKVKVENETKEPVNDENYLNFSHSSQDDFKPIKLERSTVKEDIMESEEDEKKLVIKEDVQEYEDKKIVTEEEFLDDEKMEQEDPDYDQSDDDVPLVRKVKQKKGKKVYEESDDDVPLIKKKTKLQKKSMADEEQRGKRLLIKEEQRSPAKKKRKVEEEHVWKWWEEEKREDGVKWKFLEHNGPVMADPYFPLPSHVKLLYKGEPVNLKEPAEEVAGFYSRMIEHEYTTKEIFNKNFFTDWRKVMTREEREKIVDLKKCDFRQINLSYAQFVEQRKNRTKEEKKELKLTNEKLIADYGWCTIDKHKQRIGNFKVEPPGLFRGRGEHPKMGSLKRRIVPEDVIINCSKDSQIPKPPTGRKWKEVRHDNAVTWLACWVENVQNQTKYVMLNAASKLKGEKDWQKYETARRLHKIIDRIRDKYTLDFKSKEMRVRQRAVALYFIDKLALRAGNEKDEDQADTVGCCSLRVEHIKLYEEKDGKEYVVAFDFLGKDSIRYYNEVPVEKRVFKNLQLFMENKQGGDDLFDRLNTQIMNKHLTELMDQLTAKVFRTYNASRTLQEQLEKLTDEDDNVPQMILSYNRANREVAILCNHQRAVPKTFDKSMANLQKKIDDKEEQLREEERHSRDLKKDAKHGGSVKEKMLYDKKKKTVERVKDQLHKLKISATDKEENKQIALSTSKLNYLDPRISVAWGKKYNVPIEKIYNKTQRQKFQWAIDMATADYNFMGEPMNITRNSTQEEDDEESEEE